MGLTIDFLMVGWGEGRKKRKDSLINLNTYSIVGLVNKVYQYFHLLNSLLEQAYSKGEICFASNWVPKLVSSLKSTENTLQDDLEQNGCLKF